MSNYVLEADDVAIHYGGVKAVDGVSLTLEPGQIRGPIRPRIWPGSSVSETPSTAFTPP